MSEYELIIKKLEIVRDSEDEGMYLCDKKHSKILLEGIDKYKQVIDKIKDICLENMYIDDRGEEVESIERDIKPSEILELLEKIE